MATTHEKIMAVTNANSGLSVKVSRVSNFLKDRAGKMRVTKPFEVYVATYVNYLVNQLCYTTIADMCKNTIARRDGSTKPKSLTLTKHALYNTIIKYALFADFRRNAAPVTGVPVNNAIVLPSAEVLKAMSPSKRQRFFKKFNYKSPEFNEDYFQELQDDEAADNVEMEVDEDGEGGVVDAVSSEDEEEEEEGSAMEDEEEDDSDEEEEDEEEEEEDDEPPSAAAKKRSRKSGKSAAEPATKRARK